MQLSLTRFVFKLLVRGESINYVNCHVQEIPENGIIIINH